MRRLLLVILMLSVAGTAFAVSTSNVAPVKNSDSYGDRATTPRVGGDTIAQAVPIALPFSDTGATCGYVNDYDEICPYSGSTAPDVVYSFAPASNIAINVDLCNSQYDTKVYIYAGGVGNLVACNDDAGCGYSGYQSSLTNVALTAGVTYYIVVDGYGSSCGTYDLGVTEYVPPPPLECPPGALLEGEPDCYDGYYDAYNGGCNSTGWTPLPGDANGCNYMCGKSGTYLFNGASYRDTDWYASVGNGQNVVFECTANFPLQMILIYGTNCSSLGYTYTQVPAGVMGSLSWFIGSGAAVWEWVGASVFSGVPCGTDYVMHVCGLQPSGPPVPTEKANWGTIKHLYK